MFKDKMLIILSNLILIVIVTIIFSAWRVYSTEIWLKELKDYIYKVGEENTMLIKNNQEIIIENQNLFKKISKQLLEKK